jgi:hypothetical protein
MVLTLDTPTQRRLEDRARQENRTTEEVAATLLASVLLTENAPTNTPNRETELWRLLEEGLPETFWLRREVLEAKAANHTLTSQEQEERLALITQMEQWQVRRLQRVVELAQIRGEQPSDLLQRLGVAPR